MTRVVVDTNVFVSSIFGGKPRRIVDLWKAGRIELCVSKAVLDEYTTVMQRFVAGHPKESAELLGLFRELVNSAFVADAPGRNVVERDPADDKFIECAVALNAEAIVSGDEHLLDLGGYIGIEILTPADFLDRMKSRE
ncbi:MAG: putative toxin-antitoxin system toxin component, PIN family [Planctomycetota bacterium]